MDRVPERTSPVNDGSNGEVAAGAAVALGLDVPIDADDQLELEADYTFWRTMPPVPRFTYL